MTIDYHAPDVVAQIKQATGASLKLAVDTISEAETHRIAAAAMGPSGGKVVGLNGLGGLESGREDVATTGACRDLPRTLSFREQRGSVPCKLLTFGRALLLTEVMIFTVFGRPINFASVQLQAVPQDKAHIVAFLRKFPQLVRDGALKPIPLRRWEGGFEGLQAGLQYMREGKVSAEKIVYTL